MPTITNINGTSETTTTCKCGGWLKHWQNFSKQNVPRSCPVDACFRQDLTGAHVQLAYTIANKWFIIPLCNYHNQSQANLDVSHTITFVPANKSETCEKY